ncbi:MAG: methionine--tRNA ligase [Candidatus Bipolaricaulia bacterium]
MKVLICSAWPYIQGMPHLGNLMSSLLSGDVFKRYYALRGDEVLYVSGSDAHGTRIEYEAERQGITPETLAKRNHKRIVSIIERFGIDFDNYTTTESPIHYRFVQEIYRQMDENGYIFTREEERAYCEIDRRFLADRFIEGTCPHCGYAGARGNQCEVCGTLLEPEELIEPRCAFCGEQEIVFRSTVHWYLDLKKLEPQLKAYVASRDWRGNVKRFTESMLRDGVEPRAVTRDIRWGIPAPFSGAEGKVIYVWAEAALGYVSATIEHFERTDDPDGWKAYWFRDEVKQVYTQAKDNVPFHTIIFPGQLLASKQGYHLPDQVAATEYLNWVGGSKFSKSRGIGLYCDEALELLDPVYWRFYLLYARPERKDVDFSWEALGRAVNGVLIDNISNFVNRVLTFVRNRFSGVVPEAETAPEIAQEIERVRTEVTRTIEGGELAPALRAIATLAVTGNAYFQREQPWEDPENAPEIVATATHLVKAIAILLYPFVPSFCESIFEILSFESSRLRLEEVSVPAAGERLGEVRVLLEKVDIEALKRRYDEMKAGQQSKQQREGSGMEGTQPGQVSMAQFQTLDLRVGKIVRVEEIDGADRLYKLTIDVGGVEMTSVGGLKAHYSREAIDGQKVVVVANLAPATIHGVRSECMVLAAVGDRVSLVVPDEDVPVGTRVQ